MARSRPQERLPSADSSEGEEDIDAQPSILADFAEIIDKMHRQQSEIEKLVEDNASFRKEREEWEATKTRLFKKLELKDNALHQAECLNRRLKERILQLKTERKSKEIRKLQEISCLNDKIKRLSEQDEKYRFAAMALKRVAIYLPSARVNEVEWQKGSITEHMTCRSKKLHERRQQILIQPQYAQRNGKRYIVENNPSNPDGNHNSAALKVVEKFVVLNDIGNVNPRIKFGRNSTKKLDQVLGIRKVALCIHAPVLVGQQETFAKVRIDKGVILGQYVGNEMLKSEFQDIYNGTKQELHHMKYCHGDKLEVNGEESEMYIDGIAACTTSPLLFINDGRADIMNVVRAEDQQRMNTEYVSCLVNGWPMILVRTTKVIEADDSLWINYGNKYALVNDAHDCVYDQQTKTLRSVKQILTGIDLEEQRPLDIFEHESDDDHRSDRSTSILSSIVSSDEYDSEGFKSPSPSDRSSLSPTRALGQSPAAKRRKTGRRSGAGSDWEAIEHNRNHNGSRGVMRQSASSL